MMMSHRYIAFLICVVVQKRYYLDFPHILKLLLVIFGSILYYIGVISIFCLVYGGNFLALKEDNSTQTKV